MDVPEVVRRILIGYPLTNDQLGQTLLPKWIGLPVLASHSGSSVAYEPDETLLTRSLAGTTALAFSWQVGLLVAGVASYRLTVNAYPLGEAAR